MCGIAGFLNTNGEPASTVLVKRMTDVIAHRGPDGEGQYVDGAIGLGHRRLAILDLSPAGHQPIQTADGRYVISYNGEVYNFNELRTELEARGYKFRSRTDTEVVLNAWAEWQEGSLDRFNGMFAFAVWDRVDRQLVLARDRYGVKPVYYTHRDDVFLFGSEIKAMLTHPRLEAGIDKEALLEYFTFQNYFTDRTLFKDVCILPAGCYLKVSQQTPQPSICRYWDFQFREPEQAGDEREYVEELSRLFKQAVNRQLVSDVEVGAYLSGGMDSGSITAVAADQLRYMRTFTCGFDLHSASGLELCFDERERAEHMSYLFKTEHYEMVLKAGDMERVLPRLTWHLEEPRVGQSYPNFYAAQLAGKFVKVVLAGTGGDELFGGYPWRYYRAAVNDDFEHYIDKYYKYWQRLTDNTTIRRIFAPIWNDVRHVWTRDIFRDVFTRHAHKLTRPEDYINHSLYFEAKTFLHGLLVVEDKLSMAHGLETRVPFLDNDLVDFAMRLPVNTKLGNLGEVVRLNENEPAKAARYFQKTKDGKLVLRQAMQRILPEEITHAVKQGFSAPDATWFKGDSIEFVRDTLCSAQCPIYELLDRVSITQRIDEHLTGARNHRLFIWSLLNFNQWIRTFLQASDAQPQFSSPCAA
ncbi:MAG: asparagine synthase (glutamine-hydrolyzing) [Planctomycetes bacterium]|nr:asparagine synthase (glutamine-hydrolyzing) [Planctomycetota bacterium]